MERRKIDSHFLVLSLTFLPRQTPVVFVASTTARAETAAPGPELPVRGRVAEPCCLSPRPILLSCWPQHHVTPAWGARGCILNLRVSFRMLAEGPGSGLLPSFLHDAEYPKHRFGCIFVDLHLFSFSSVLVSTCHVCMMGNLATFFYPVSRQRDLGRVVSLL